MLLALPPKATVLAQKEVQQTLVGITAAQEEEARACQDSHQLHCPSLDVFRPGSGKSGVGRCSGMNGAGLALLTTPLPILPGQTGSVQEPGPAAGGNPNRGAGQVSTRARLLGSAYHHCRHIFTMSVLSTYYGPLKCVLQVNSLNHHRLSVQKSNGSTFQLYPEKWFPGASKKVQNKVANY